LSAGGDWHPAKSTYLFPVRALSRHFRGGYVSRLRQAYKDGRLSRVRNRAEVDRVLNALMATEWVVYSKPCLNRAETVVDYLGRYSHRIALADSRIKAFDGESAQLSYKDYRDGDRRKVMTLTGEELLRRFLLHVLPKGFMRVRHFGFLAGLPDTALGADPHRAGRAAAGRGATRAGRAVRRLSLSQVPHRTAARDRAPGPAAAAGAPARRRIAPDGAPRARAEDPPRTDRRTVGVCPCAQTGNRLRSVPNLPVATPYGAVRMPYFRLAQRPSPRLATPRGRRPSGVGGYNPLSLRCAPPARVLPDPGSVPGSD
jgi:hypothetical protein